MSHAQYDQSPSAGRPQKLGRPRKSPDELRVHDLRVLLSPAEKLKLEQDIAATGQSAPDYVRQLIIGYTPKPIDHSYQRMLYELNAIGVNLNQIVRDMHSDRIPKQNLKDVLGLLKAALEKVISEDVH